MLTPSWQLRHLLHFALLGIHQLLMPYILNPFFEIVLTWLPLTQKIAYYFTTYIARTQNNNNNNNNNNKIYIALIRLSAKRLTIKLV